MKSTKLNKILAFAFFAIFAATLVSCDSEKKILKDYESFARIVLKAAEEGESHKLENLKARNDEFLARADKLKRKGDWSRETDERFSELSAKVNAAFAELSVTSGLKDLKNSLNEVGKKLGL